MEKHCTRSSPLDFVKTLPVHLRRGSKQNRLVSRHGEETSDNAIFVSCPIKFSLGLGELIALVLLGVNQTDLHLSDIIEPGGILSGGENPEPL